MGQNNCKEVVDEQGDTIVRKNYADAKYVDCLYFVNITYIGREQEIILRR